MKKNKIIACLILLICFLGSCTWDEDCYDTENQFIINFRPGIDSVKVTPELPFIIQDLDTVLSTYRINVPSDSLKIDIYSGKVISEFSFELIPMRGYTIDISKEGEIDCKDLFFYSEIFKQDSLNICLSDYEWDCP